MSLIKEIFYSLSKKIAKSFNNKNSNPRVCLYGAGQLCEDFLNYFDLSDLNIIGIIDKDKSKEGKKLCCHPIYNPDKLMELNPDILIITLLNSTRAIEYLKEFKILNSLSYGIEDKYSTINLLRYYYNFIKFIKWKKTTFSNKFKLNKFIKKNKDIKLHLGCGKNYFNDWINIDNNSDNNIEKLDFNWDLRKNLPIPDNSVDFIYNEHFLEHLTVEEGQKSIKDFLRVLKPNGVMRIAMPNLKAVIDLYLDDNWKANNKESFEKYGLEHMRTKAELININFRNWGHKWLYDWEELERRLKEAGAKEITKCEIFKSQYIELNNLETRNESTLIAEMKK